MWIFTWLCSRDSRISCIRVSISMVMVKGIRHCYRPYTTTKCTIPFFQYLFRAKEKRFSHYAERQRRAHLKSRKKKNNDFNFRHIHSSTHNIFLTLVHASTNATSNIYTGACAINPCRHKNSQHDAVVWLALESFSFRLFFSSFFVEHIFTQIHNSICRANSVFVARHFINSFKCERV